MRVSRELMTAVIKVNEVHILNMLAQHFGEDDFISDMREENLLLNTEQPLRTAEGNTLAATYFNQLMACDDLNKYYVLLKLLNKHVADQVKDYMIPDTYVADLRRYHALTVEALYKHYTMMRPLLDIDTANTLLQREDEQEKQKLNIKLKKYFTGSLTNEALMPQVLNFVLLGKTGNGKSATANMLSGSDEFTTSSSDIGCTQHIKLMQFELDGITVNIIDTPGLMDLKKTEAEVITEIGKVIAEFRDGIHAFLYVYNLADPRFTEQDLAVFNLISKKIFGDDSTNHCIAVLTHVDSVPDFSTLSNYLNANRDSAFKQLLNDVLQGRVIAVNNSEPTVYGMTTQRRNVIKFIMQNSNGLYSSEKFRQFQQGIEDLSKDQPACIRKFVPLIDELSSMKLQDLNRSKMRDMQSEDRLNMAAVILQEIKQEEQVKEEWENIIVRVTVECLLEKTDRILNIQVESDEIRHEDDLLLKKLSKEEDKLRLEIRSKNCELKDSNNLAAEAKVKLQKDIKLLKAAADAKRDSQNGPRKAIKRRELKELAKDILYVALVATPVAVVAGGVMAVAAAAHGSFGQFKEYVSERLWRIRRFRKCSRASRHATYNLADNYEMGAECAQEAVEKTLDDKVDTKAKSEEADPAPVLKECPERNKKTDDVTADSKRNDKTNDVTADSENEDKADDVTMATGDDRAAGTVLVCDELTDNMEGIEIVYVDEETPNEGLDIQSPD